VSDAAICGWCVCAGEVSVRLYGLAVSGADSGVEGAWER
jgi:hypothetical protein